MILDQDHPADQDGDQDNRADQDHPADQDLHANLDHPGVSAEHVLDPAAQHQVPPGHPTLPLLPLLPGLNIMTTMATAMLMMMMMLQVCLERPIYPCRSLCLGVRQGCQGRMEAYGFPWSVPVYYTLHSSVYSYYIACMFVLKWGIW